MPRIVASFALACLSLMVAYSVMAVWPPKLANTDDAAFAIAVPKDVHVVSRAGSAD